MEQSNTINFAEQAFHLGLDTHSKNWRVTINYNHLELKTYVANPSPQELAEKMNREYPGGIYHSVYEAGFCGYWIHRELELYGFKNIIVNAADVPTSHKEKDRKRDPIDSRKLARELENGSLKGIYIPTEEQQALRSISRLYYQAVKSRIRIKNRIKGFLHFHGIKMPYNYEISHWSNAFIHWLKKIEFKKAHDKYYFECQLSRLESCRMQIKQLLDQMRKISKENKIIQCMRTVPGVALVTSFTLYAELMDMKRFSSLDKLASMIGLVPSVRSSDDKEKVKGITPRYSKYLRQNLIESAWIAARKDPALTLCYGEYCKRMKKQLAIIKITRKLLSRIRYVWLNETQYVKSVVV
jgi:transposase